MTPKEKAQQIFDNIFQILVQRGEHHYTFYYAKQCAIIAVENEYHSLREMLFNLKSCHVIESEKVYLFRLQKLIHEELEITQEIKAL
jgi:hypothetical protein